MDSKFYSNEDKEEQDQQLEAIASMYVDNAQTIARQCDA